MTSNEQQELERLFSSHPCIKDTLEQACGLSNKNPDTEEAQPIFRDRESLLRHVVQRAKELGTWIEKIEDYVKQMIGNGQENDVFISKDDLYAIKLNNFALLSDSATNLDGFLHRLISHNMFFPEDSYTILGLAYNSSFEPCVVLRQPFIEPLRYATNAEIDNFLESHDYTVDMDDIWFNGQYEISDVKSSNVIVDMEGNYHFIDAVVNNVNFNIDSVNRISIKHPGKRSAT